MWVKNVLYIALISIFTINIYFNLFLYIFLRIKIRYLADKHKLAYISLEQIYARFNAEKRCSCFSPTTLLLEHASSNLRPNDRSIVTRKRYNRFVSLYRGYYLATHINML